MGKRERDKGNGYEREVAEMLREVWPDARRGIGQARAAGEIPDVTKTPYWWETKHRKAISVPAAVRQAKAAMADYLARGGHPDDFRSLALSLRWDTGVPFEKRDDLVVLPMAEFIRLAKLAEAVLTGAIGPRADAPAVAPAGPASSPANLGDPPTSTHT